MFKLQFKRKYGIKAGIYLAAATFFTYCWYTQYYQWLDCFNELGRCFSPDDSGVVYTTSGIVWAFPAIVFLVLASIDFF